MPAWERPTYAIQILQPFAELLEDEGEISDLMNSLVRTVGDRVLVEVAHRGLEVAVEYMKDPDLGLKAARRLVLGDVGALDYLMRSAPTVRDAIAHVASYSRLVNDALEVSVHVEGPTAILRLDHNVVLPRAALDFVMGGVFRNHVCEWFADRLPEVTVWFMHQTPEALGEYERTFGAAKLRFNAPAYAFVFDRRLLDLPVPGADPNLHAVMLPFAEQSLEKRPASRSVTMNVRQLIEKSLGSGAPDLAEVASELGMGMRTLARRLEQEGTSFRALTDDVRRVLALEYVGKRDVDFSEIAYRLGFSHAAAFHRAFRRWTAQTPLAYRRASGR